MADSSRTIMTDAGFALETRVRADETKMQFTRAAISTDDHFSDTDDVLAKLTELADVQQDGKVTAVQVINTTTVHVQVDVNQAESKTDYQMRSAALYAKDDDGTEILYGVTVLQDPVFVHKDADGSYLGFGINTTVGRASNVVVVVDPANMVTQQVFESTMKNYYTKTEVDAKFVTDDDFASKLPENIATTDAANTFTKSQTLAGGATDGNGNAYATQRDVDSGDASTLASAKGYTDAAVKPLATSASVTAGDSSTLATAKSYTDTIGKAKVNVADTSNWQQQALFTKGDYKILAVPSGSDFRSYIMAHLPNPGIYYVRDDTTSGVLTDVTLISEGNGSYKMSGINSHNELLFRSFTTATDTGWQRALKSGDVAPSSILGHNLTGNDDVFNLSPGFYPIVGTAPKNSIPGITWGWIQVIDSGNRFLRWFDVSGHEQINTYWGSPAHWSGWRAPNSSILGSGTDLNTVIMTGTYLLNGIAATNLPSGLTSSQWMTLYVAQIGGSNGTQILVNSNNSQMWIRSWHNGNIFTPWAETVMASPSGTITVNGTTYAPVQSDPTSGNIAKVHNLVNGVKINGHLINIDPTNGLTIDGTPLINVVADEATAKAKSANDKLHLWVTKE